MVIKRSKILVEFDCGIKIENLEEVYNIISETADFILKEFKLENMYVEYLITDNQEIRQLNREFRNIDRETDVLSFPNFQGEISCGESKKECLGSIVLSYERALEQAKEYNHSEKRELAFLTTHSMLHLLGYDHIEKDEEEEMKALSYELLNKLNISREEL